MVGFSQKCTAALRILAYGALGDSEDDYIHMAELRPWSAACLDSARQWGVGVWTILPKIIQ
jgi:hypothetical protein